MRTFAYGFPRLGEKREYKFAIESYWRKEISEEELKKELYNLEKRIEDLYKEYVDIYPAGEMSFYDPMLDTAIMLGLYKASSLEEYYALARGKNALELTKWFNTNYHYLVPEIPSSPQFFLQQNLLKEKAERTNKKNVSLIAPFTFLKLSKGNPQKMDFLTQIV